MKQNSDFINAMINNKTGKAFKVEIYETKLKYTQINYYY